MVTVHWINSIFKANTQKTASPIVILVLISGLGTGQVPQSFTAAYAVIIMD